MRLEMKYKATIGNVNGHYWLELEGAPLDGESLKILSTNMLNDIRSILCYDYEDGKPWHDVTCVMALAAPDDKETIPASSEAQQNR